jgi:hypothetical protein
VTSWYSYRQRNRSVSWRFRGLSSTRQGPGTPPSPVHHHNPPSRSQLSLLDSTVFIDHQSRQVTSPLPSSSKPHIRYHDHIYHGCHSSLHHAPSSASAEDDILVNPTLLSRTHNRPRVPFSSRHDTSRYDTTTTRSRLGNVSDQTGSINYGPSSLSHPRGNPILSTDFSFSPSSIYTHTYTYTTTFASPSIDTTNTTDTTAFVYDLSRWVFMG